MSKIPQLRVALLAGLIADLRTHDTAMLNREYGDLYRGFVMSIDDYMTADLLKSDFYAVLDRLADWLEGAIKLD